MKRTLTGKQYQGILLALLIAFALVFPVIMRDKPYWLYVALQSFFWAMMASSWALLAGYAGQFSFAHIAFMGIASYTSGMAGQSLGWSPVSGIILGAIVAGLVGLFVGYLCLRLRSTYLALFTIAFSEIVRLIINAEHQITGGPMGMYLDPLIESTSYVPVYYTMLAALAVALMLMYAIANSRFGLFFRSIREDEEAAAAMGVHVVRYKIAAFVVTAMIAGAAGALDHHIIGFIAPNELMIPRMSLIIAMAVIGGTESLISASIGAVFIHFLMEWLQKIPVSDAMMAKLQANADLVQQFGLTLGDGVVQTNAWRMALFGLLLMLTLRFRRNGIIQPLLEKLGRQGVAEETVAKRKLPQEDDDVEALS
ncbi:MAG TPA: branched-chain amino acid ABC transporter permease [Anaerolineales bacterium]|nr:branched-chain amino acid ABC transporter permease [Anaerolineales bacterium]